MFSGIIEATGIIKAIEEIQDCLHAIIHLQEKWDDLHVGDSVSVNGVCLTVTKLIDNAFNVVIVPETLRLTAFKALAQNDKVNLERSLKANSRIGGHYVQGHIDSTGEIIDLKDDGKGAWLLKIKAPHHLLRYIVNKGYIGIDGMSITVNETASDWFSITLIPHTRQVTIANQYKIGSKVNLEVDILGKYIEKLINKG